MRRHFDTQVFENRDAASRSDEPSGLPHEVFGDICAPTIIGDGHLTDDVEKDFAIVRSMVFIGSILYILGLILTDISYTWADPRVRLS